MKYFKPRHPQPIQEPRQIIFLNTMPKSASRTIARTLSKVYGTKFTVTAGGQYLNAILSRGVFQRLRDGRHISQEHVFPTLYNKMVLEEQLERMVFHVRDPRQAIVSWAHHLQNQFERGNFLPLTALEMPDEYKAYSIEKKLDYVIEHHFQFFVDWLRAWRTALPSMAIPVLTTRFEDMKENPTNFFEHIIEFLEIKPLEPLVIDQPEPGVMHYRVGKVDEWREIATPDQQTKMNNIIGADLFDYFGWSAG